MILVILSITILIVGAHRFTRVTYLCTRVDSKSDGRDRKHLFGTERAAYFSFASPTSDFSAEIIMEITPCMDDAGVDHFSSTLCQ